MVADNMQLDHRTRRLVIDGRKIALSSREWSVMEVLMKDPGRAYTCRQLVPEQYTVEYARGLIQRLRIIVGKNNIVTCRGYGYRLNVD